MRDEDLSVKERAVLFALMAEAREVSNSELAARAGFRLDGKERRRLNDRKLVGSRRAGRAFAHELTDAGWDWCATHLSESRLGGSMTRASSMEGALYAVLDGLARYLDHSEQSLADIFGNPRPESPQPQGPQPQGPQPESPQPQGPQPESPQPQGPQPGTPDGPAAIAELIEAAYLRLAAGPGRFVKLTRLRDGLSGIRRDVLDSVLTDMYRAQRVNLVPQANQQALTQADREAALRVGGEAKHLISARPDRGTAAQDPEQR